MTSQLLINEPPLQVLPTLAQKIGLNEAIVLQQVHYWINPQFNKNLFEGRYWVRNTYEQWQRQFSFWGERTIRRTFANLEELGLLASFVTDGFHKIKYYTINYDQLNIKDVKNPLTKSFSLVSQQVNFEKVPENQYIDSSGQVDLTGRKNLSSNTFLKEVFGESIFEKSEEISQLSPSGQNGQIDLAKRADRSGQLGQTDQANLARHLENTPENIYILPPPLIPPPATKALPKIFSTKISFEKSQKEEEEDEEKYFEFKNANENADKSTGNSEAKAQGSQTEHHQKTQICQEMIDIWSRVVQSKLTMGRLSRFGSIHLTQSRKTLLMAFLEAFFPATPKTDKLEAWGEYCNLIAQSKFLLGQNASGFKINLEWALVPANALKVMEGAIYDKPEPNQKLFEEQSWEGFSQKLSQTLPVDANLCPWLKISINLAKRIGQLKYWSWFEKVLLKSLTETTATFAVEGEFTKNHISNHFADQLKQAVQVHYPTVTKIVFLADSSEASLSETSLSGMSSAREEKQTFDGDLV